MKFTAIISLTVDGLPCLEFRRGLDEDALLALLTPRAERGDVLDIVRRGTPIGMVPVYDRRTGHPFALVERTA